MVENLSEKVKPTQRLEKSYYPTEYLFRVLIIQRHILAPLAKTSITPNQITYISIALGIFSYIAVYYECLILAGCFYILCNFTDHIDGMFARYINSSSEFGKKLDMYGDAFATNFIFIIYAISYPQSLLPCFLVLVAMNTHSLVCPLYIVKNIKKITANGGVFKRFGLKKWFLDRGFLLGVDASFLGIVVSLGLIFNIFELACYILAFAYSFDMLYRINELKRNLKKT